MHAQLVMTRPGTAPETTTVTLKRGPCFVTCEDVPLWAEYQAIATNLDSHFDHWLAAAREGQPWAFATVYENNKIVRINH